MPKLPKSCHELSLRPYSGKLIAVLDRKDYLRTHRAVYGSEGRLDRDCGGKFAAGCAGRDGKGDWTYLIWASGLPKWAHEISHVLLDLLPKLGFNLNDVACDEAFCYMMQVLLEDIETLLKEKH